MAPKATEDTIIASFLSDLIVEEGRKYTMKSVDCKTMEHSEYMTMKNFVSNQVKHVIGMRQTAKTQVTDVRYARLGKVAAEKEKQMRRKVHRVAGNIAGELIDITAFASMIAKGALVTGCTKRSPVTGQRGGAKSRQHLGAFPAGSPPRLWAPLS